MSVLDSFDVLGPQLYYLRKWRDAVAAVDPGTLDSFSVAERSLALRRLDDRIAAHEALFRADSLFDDVSRLSFRATEADDAEAAKGLPNEVERSLARLPELAGRGEIPPRSHLAGRYEDHLKRALDASPDSAGNSALPALRRLIEALSLADRDGAERQALGAEAYAWRLRWDLGISQAPGAIAEDAMVKAEALRTRARRLAAELHPQLSLANFAARLDAAGVADDAETLTLFRKAVSRAMAFKPARRAFPIGRTVSPHLELSPDLTRDFPWAAAAYDWMTKTIIVPDSGGDPSVLRAQRPLMIASYAAHEGYPGHHYQWDRFTDPRYGKLIPIPAFGHPERTISVEGYAFYVQKRLDEMGFYLPHERLAYWLYRLRHLIESVAEAGLHSGTLTRVAAERFLVEESFTSDDEATRIVDALLARPGFFPSYRLGMERIESIKASARAALGRRFTEGVFHEALLSFGPVRLDVVAEHIAGRMLAL